LEPGSELEDSFLAVDMVAVAVVAEDRDPDVVARRDAGKGLGGWDLAVLVEGWSMCAGGIFLRWRCLYGRGGFLVAWWVVVRVVGMCLLVGVGKTFCGSEWVCWIAVRMVKMGLSK
jgi:hypothetical protein